MKKLATEHFQPTNRPLSNMFSSEIGSSWTLYPYSNYLQKALHIFWILNTSRLRNQRIQIKDFVVRYFVAHFECLVRLFWWAFKKYVYSATVSCPIRPNMLKIGYLRACTQGWIIRRETESQRVKWTSWKDFWCLRLRELLKLVNLNSPTLRWRWLTPHPSAPPENHMTQIFGQNLD